MNYARHTHRGFTLIEVLVSILILGAMLVFYTSSFSATKLTRDAQRKDVALRVIEQKLEELRALTYAGLPASGTFSDPLLTSLPNGIASTTISTYNAAIKKATVGVSWIEGSSTLRYIESTTLITQVGGL